MMLMPKSNGEGMIKNAATLAIAEAQNEFTGVAKRLDYPTEAEIQSWVDKIRYDE